MARLLQHIVSPQQACSYLPRTDAVMESRIMLDVTPDEYDLMLCRGWRRFGPTYFRPRCGACSECVGLRIPVAGFQPSRSQKRALKKCSEIRVEVGVPKVSADRLDLYHAWHAQREDARGWGEDTVDAEQYFLQFCFPHPCARELAYFDGDRLVAVGIVDETPTAFSSVYFFFHPDYRKHSIGVASVLHEIRLAAQRGRQWLYMGYRVRDCASLRYKADYRPHELLLGRPLPEEDPQWVPQPAHPLGAMGASAEPPDDSGA